MGKQVETIVRPGMNLPRKKRVAAYARVSSGKDAMLHSLSAQISSYSSLIQKTPGWQFVKVYADSALTGTKDNRAGFQQMLADCKAGQIDLIICKSISRFARNTVTLLTTVRDLKSLGIDVYFEEQNIHTLSADGELMLTILASYAQEESRSASENQKWRIRRNFESGKPWNGVMLGYRQKDGKYIIVPEEAEIVRRIFREYLAGNGVVSIANGLNADGVLTQKGFVWHKSAVHRILRNFNYTGNLLLQRYYSENHITKRKCVNAGELPQYYAERTHEAIIDIETFQAAQQEIAHRAEKHTPRPARQQYPYSGIIVCSMCGKHYRRKVKSTGAVWICSTYNSQGKQACASKAIPEATLDRLTANINIEDLTSIRVETANRLVFLYKDGSAQEACWQDRSRADSWTPEMRQRARERKIMNMEAACNGNR